MFVPFKTTICGIDELGDHCALGVTHVLSILDPDAPEPPVFGSFGEHSRVELRFHDVIEELPDRVVPGVKQVQEILALGRGLTSAAATDAHLLVHCHAGVSRSTAAMTLILGQACPGRSGIEIIHEVLRIRSRVELRFHDVIEELPDRVVPGVKQVQEILALGRGLTSAAATDAHLLVHCHAGVSRSTAAMTLILGQACPGRSGIEIIHEVLRIRSRAWPNLRIIELGDELLGRGGDLIGSVPIAYHSQLERRPELAEIFVREGRGREVQRARAVL